MQTNVKFLKELARNVANKRSSITMESIANNRSRAADRMSNQSRLAENKGNNRSVTVLPSERAARATFLSKTNTLTSSRLVNSLLDLPIRSNRFVKMGSSTSKCDGRSSDHRLTSVTTGNSPPHLTGCRSIASVQPKASQTHCCGCFELNPNQQSHSNQSQANGSTFLYAVNPLFNSTSHANCACQMSLIHNHHHQLYSHQNQNNLLKSNGILNSSNANDTCCDLLSPSTPNHHSPLCVHSGQGHQQQHHHHSTSVFHPFSPFSGKLASYGRSLLMMNGHSADQQNANSSNSAIQKRNLHNQPFRGMDLLREPNLNKDLAYTHKEREQFGIKGLIPPAVRSQELQARIAIQQFRQLDGNLAKYMYLRDLQDYNKRLFYRLLCEYVEELMPIVYTPVVGEACLKYSELYKRPRGLFITKHDRGHVYDILCNWPEKEIKAIVVTDGERILGLGDLGANGMGIPVGKLALYSALAGVPPHMTLPVTLDVGTNNEDLINSETYIGLKEKRERGELYDELVQEFMEAVVKKWGRTCLIQFEDFGNSNAFKLLEKYRDHYCTFNDDIQGTASVAVAGVIAACRRLKQNISQQRILFMGAGGAALGISDLLVMAMEREGLATKDARNNIYLIDSKGLVSLKRENEKDPHKLMYAKDLPMSTNLAEIIDLVKPTCLVGVCAQPNVFTEQVLRKMAQHNTNPIIFPLSNPTSKAECTAEQAYTYTDGRAIFASGSPFDIFKYKDQTFIPGQGNNSYIFPGIALAVMSCNVPTIPEEVFLVAARALADQVTVQDLSEGRVYPPLKKIQEVSIKIAAKVAQFFFVQGLASVRPEPDDKELFIRQHQYNYSYDNE